MDIQTQRNGKEWNREKKLMNYHFLCIFATSKHQLQLEKKEFIKDLFHIINLNKNNTRLSKKREYLHFCNDFTIL